MSAQDQIASFNDALAGRYRVEGVLGEGGMAVVYVAEDLRHDRRVALKVLKPELAAIVGSERFLVEIKTTAKLQHPHVVPLFDSGEVGGLPFFVMPLVNGESVQDRIAREGPLPVQDALRITRECAEALAHAHEEGVIHRDVKPSNVLLRGEHALIADFGVAGAVVSAANSREALTGTGVSLGTVGYMSPEQASGEGAIDARTDVYALGCLLYEMLSGERAFRGATPFAVVARQLEGAPPITTVRPSVSPSIEEVIRTACAPVPADRYRSAEELYRVLSELEGASRGRSRSADPGGVAAGGLGRWVVPATVALAVAAGFAAFAYRGGTAAPAGGDPEGGAPSRIAVLPFEVLGPGEDDAFFADGVRRDVHTHLSKVGGLTILAREGIDLAYREGRDLAEVAREVRADALVRGAVLRAGDQVRIDAQLVDPVTSEDLWAESYTRRMEAENVFGIMADVARQVADALEVSLSPDADARLGAAPTGSLEAYDLFVRGFALYSTRQRERVLEAERLFHAAIDIDPEYSLPWTGLTLVAVRRVFGMGQERAWADSALLYARRAEALGPESAEVHTALAMAASILERKREAVAEHERALEFDPYALASLNNLGFEYRRLGRFDRALEPLHRAHAVAPNHPLPSSNLSASFRALGMYEEAEAWAQHAARATAGESDVASASFASARNALFQGDVEGAMRMADTLVSAGSDEIGTLMEGAEVAFLARDFPRAVEWSRGAVERLAPDNIWRNSEHGSQVLLGLALTLGGDRIEAEPALRQAVARYEERIEGGAEFWLFPYGIAAAHAALEEVEPALEWLDEAYDAGFRLIEVARLDPALDPLRADVRFDAWLDRIEADLADMRARARAEGLDRLPR